MPKATFNNLSDDKKRRIFDAAVKEFSTQRFSQASINQIVKEAGIPRGSFYQYFNDKEDLFLYMFTEIAEEKKKVAFEKVFRDHDYDFLEACSLSVEATYEWAMAKPEYSRIGLLMEIDESEFIVNLRNESVKVLKEMIERDQKRGLFKKEFDSDLIVDMLYSIIMNTMKEYYYKGDNWPDKDGKDFLKRVNDAINIIRHGISTGSK